MKSVLYALLVVAVVASICLVVKAEGDATDVPTTTLTSVANNSIPTTLSGEGSSTAENFTMTSVFSESATTYNYNWTATSGSPGNGSTASSATGNITVSSSSETATMSAGPVTITSAPTGAPSTTACPKRTGFDAASFVGGIVLVLGVMIILVIIVKCYQHHVRKSELHYSQF